MSSHLERSERGAAPGTFPFGRLDRMFDEWMRMFPAHRGAGWPWEMHGDEVISVDEFHDGQTQVIRAELPGIDPDRDVTLTVSQGMLRIDAERRVETDIEDKGYTRHELRYGRFTRTLPLAEGATESDITATYRDGILEIRVPVPAQPAQQEPTRIPVSKG